LRVLVYFSPGSERFLGALMSRQTKHFYEFGGFRLEPDERLLRRAGEVVPRKPKAFDLLLVLVAESGHLLGKEELLQKVWPDSIVEEANLSHNIYKLREALGEG
jgi:DNA-binding winged helix-turn-helix (wHTH) protein